ncbi:MAG: ATP citrate synthase, partial [Methanothrix sp.]|nr:ATP citrate synthase [Methanothrix sp.]
SRIMSATAKRLGKTIIGPATVGGMTAGAFRIGNTAGTIENIIASRLYRPGCVGFVSKSGGMLNEAFNIISRNSNGIYEGVAIGGDRYPGSNMLDHIMRAMKQIRISR